MSENKKSEPSEVEKAALPSNNASESMSSEDIERLLASKAFGAFVKEKGLKQIMDLNKEIKASYEAFTKSAQPIIASQSSEALQITSQVKDKRQESLEQASLPVWAAEIKAKLELLEKEKEKEGKRQSALSMLASSSLPKALQTRWAIG